MQQASEGTSVFGQVGFSFVCAAEGRFNQSIVQNFYSILVKIFDIGVLWP